MTVSFKIIIIAAVMIIAVGMYVVKWVIGVRYRIISLLGQINIGRCGERNHAQCRQPLGDWVKVILGDGSGNGRYDGGGEKKFNAMDQ